MERKLPMSLELDNNMPTTKEFTLPNGNTIIANRKDPYGFWDLSLSVGNLPSKYTGVYTSLYEAEKAIKEYTNNIPKTVNGNTTLNTNTLPNNGKHLNKKEVKDSTHNVL